MIRKKNNLRGFAWFAILAVVAALAVIAFIAVIPFFPRTGTAPSKNGVSRTTVSPGAATATGTTQRIVSAVIPSSTVAKKIAKPPHTASIKNSGNVSSSVSLVPPRVSGGMAVAPTLVPAAQSSTAAISASSSSGNASSSLPPEMSINPDAIVGILCYFNTIFTDPQNGVVATGSQEEVRGSGVIIDPRGYVLTNRHVIEQPEATTTVLDTNGNNVSVVVDYSLDHCEVGQVAADSYLPTPSEIESLNPYIQVPVLGYTAQPVYISSTSGLSANEITAADFAILTITGITKAGAAFGMTAVPSFFPYAELFSGAQYLTPGTQVVTYGFPGNITTEQGNSFETLTMTGSVGTVTEIEVGDRFYADTPLIILTNMDVTRGRSGSPLFWRGYVVGLVTFYIGNNRMSSGSVASEAILKALRLTNYNPIYDR